MSKDWTGNSNSVYKTLASSHHTVDDRQINDYYATEPRAAELLLKIEKFSNNIWEPACGEGHLAKVFEKHGYNVRSSDLIDRGYGEVVLTQVVCELPRHEAAVRVLRASRACYEVVVGINRVKGMDKSEVVRCEVCDGLVHVGSMVLQSCDHEKNGYCALFRLQAERDIEEIKSKYHEKRENT